MPRTYLPMTQDRRDAFLTAYKASFSNFSSACRAVAVAPDSSLANPPARSTWLLLRESDPAFKAALADADAEVRDQVFEEVRNRALNGTLEGIYQKGSRVYEPQLDENDKVVRDEDGEIIMVPASIRRFDSRLLLRLASRIDAKWSERVQHEHSGTVEHKLITMQDLDRMSPDELEVIDKALAILDNKKEPAAIEHKPELSIIDVEVEVEAEKFPAWVEED